MTTFEILYLIENLILIGVTTSFYVYLFYTEKARRTELWRREMRDRAKARIRGAEHGMLQSSTQSFLCDFPNTHEVLLEAYDELLREPSARSRASLKDYISLMEGKDPSWKNIDLKEIQRKWGKPT